MEIENIKVVFGRQRATDQYGMAGNSQYGDWETPMMVTGTLGGITLSWVTVVADPSVWDKDAAGQGLARYGRAVTV